MHGHAWPGRGRWIMRKWGFFLVLILLAGGVIAVTLHPLSSAAADRMRAASAGAELAALARAEETAAAAALRVQEKQQTSAARVGVTWLGLGAVAAAIMAGAGAVTFRAAADMVNSTRAARLPVTRQIAPGAYVAELDGRFWLIDSYSGRRALLSSAADVDQVRADIQGRLLVTDRLATAAERIAISTRSPAPADMLPSMGLLENGAR